MIISFQVPDQLLHSDVPFDSTDFEKPTIFIGLVALQSDTSIRICPGSHHSSKAFLDVQLLELDKYEYIVCHPKLIHSGCGANQFNYRLHFYHGIPKKHALETFYPKINKTTRSELMANAREANAAKMIKKHKQLEQLAEARECRNKN